MFYGWFIVTGVFLVQMLQTGFMTYAFGLLVIPMQADLGASRAEMMYGMTATTFLGLFLSPLFGAMVDTRSVRVLMTGGAVALSGGLFLMSLVPNSYLFAVVFGISIAISAQLLGPLTGSSTISRWFVASRGRALGIAAIGTSVGGLLVPALVGHWLETVGWRTCLQYLSITVALTALPYCAFIIRGKPQDMGLLPEGELAGHAGSANAGDQMLDTRAILGNPAFWYIGLCVGLLFSVYGATMANLPAYASGLGMDSAERLIMTIAVAGFIGKLLFGYAADRISLKLGLWLALGLVCIAMLIFTTEPGPSVLFIGCTLMGLAAGGMLPVWGALLARAFGVVSYGRAMGLMGPLITLLVMPSFQFVGAVYDRYNSYSLCFMVFAGLLVLAALLLIPLRTQSVANA